MKKTIFTAPVKKFTVVPPLLTTFQVSPDVGGLPPDIPISPNLASPSVTLSSVVDQLFRDYLVSTSAKASTSDQVSTVILESGSDHMSSVPPTDTLNSKSRPNTKIKPPKKPDSSFTLYVKQHRDSLTKKGLSDDEALNKAVKAWRNTTAVVKNKYQKKYEKLNLNTMLTLESIMRKSRIMKAEDSSCTRQGKG